MTRPTLTVVGSGQPEPDDEAVKQAHEVAAAIIGSTEAGFGYWVMLDGDPPKAIHGGNLLEMSALAEEIARDMKCAALGLE